MVMDITTSSPSRSLTMITTTPTTSVQNPLKAFRFVYSLSAHVVSHIMSNHSAPLFVFRERKIFKQEEDVVTLLSCLVYAKKFLSPATDVSRYFSEMTQTIKSFLC
jgi:hypothetical protein